MGSILIKVGRSMLLAAVIAAGGWLVLLGEIVRFAERDETRPADAAIVLGAAVRREYPTPIFRERINHAIDLYHDGVVDTVIFTGGVGWGDTVSEAAVARRYAIDRGVDPNAILIEERSTNTIENLTFAYQVAQGRDLETFLIVSTPYHMKRALWITHDLGMDAYSSPTRSIRWRSDRTRRRALIQESISFVVHFTRRLNGAFG